MIFIINLFSILVISTTFGVSLKSQREKRLARISHPDKAEVMTKNDYKNDKFKKYSTKKPTTTGRKKIIKKKKE